MYGTWLKGRMLLLWRWTMSRAVDLNSDVGESFGAWTLGDDAHVLDRVTSANVACGFHAGDPQIMLATVRAARDRGVAVGAHPGYPDLVGFGRRAMTCTSDEVYALCLYQIGALAALCRAEGVPLCHVKAHGALYNQSARDPDLARALARATRDAAPALILLGLPRSQHEAAARETSVPFAAEALPIAPTRRMVRWSLVPMRAPSCTTRKLSPRASSGW